MFKSPAAQAVFAWAIGAYLAFALRTTRWRLIGEAHAAPAFADRATIVAFWHERLPLMVQLWNIAQSRGAHARPHVLVSRHRDGRLIGRVMARFRTGTVHGSSSKGGASALRACLDTLRAGDHVVITPDGPAARAVKPPPGTVQLAALSGAAILPCAAQTTRRLTLNTWDRMALPLPFGRGVLVCGAPVIVPRAAWQSALPSLATALNEAAAEADRACGLHA